MALELISITLQLVVQIKKNNVVCLYNCPSVNKKLFLEHFEVPLESCCQMSNCFLVGDMIIDLLEASAIGKMYLNSLKVNGCYQGKKKRTYA